MADMRISKIKESCEAILSAQTVKSLESEKTPWPKIMEIACINAFCLGTKAEHLRQCMFSFRYCGQYLINDLKGDK